MKREELAHLLRAASHIAGDNNVVVIGSQAILGTFDESELPDRATMSREADFTFWDDADESKSDAVDGAIGEESQFDDTFAYYAQGVSITTAILPEGWGERLVEFRVASSEPAIGWCLEPHDLALSKLAVHREKDYEFVSALLDEGLLDAEIMTARLPSMDIPSASRNRISAWIAHHSS